MADRINFFGMNPKINYAKFKYLDILFYKG